MEELYYRSKTGAPITFTFITTSGRVAEVKAEDLPVTSPYSPKYDPSAKVTNMEEYGHFRLPIEVVRFLKTPEREIDSLAATDGSSDCKIATPDTGEFANTCSINLTSPSPRPTMSSRSTSAASTADGATVPLSMIYNEYGELVSAHAISHPPHSRDMTVLQILRIIKKGYRHNYRKKVGKVISELLESRSSLVLDDGSCILSQRLLSWEFNPSVSKFENPVSSATPDETPSSVAVFNGPPRILEIGCGDGSWCFQVKEKFPDWIIEGLDDVDLWSGAHKDIVLRDFIESDPSKAMDNDYFGTVHSSQEEPEFTVRNISHLLKHENPIPHNLYGLIRARDIFDKVESYKSFLEDVRLILQPDGVVEFLEIDPRPRLVKAGRSRTESGVDHTSGPMSGWTDSIADRFKNKNDEQFSTEIPGWMGRVEEDLKATLRPRDGIPGPQLKSWLEGTGFWDVKHNVVRLPVGGDSTAGQLMKDYILFKHENEDEIPNLKAALPKIEVEAIESGAYYLNLHIVTGRKACIPRAGDLLLNGARQEMTALKYEVMARTEAPKTNQWKRFDLEDELTGLVHGLSNLSGAPETISPRFALTIPKTEPATPLPTHQDPALAPRSAKASAAALASSSENTSPPLEADGVDEVEKPQVASAVTEIKAVENEENKGEEVEMVESVEKFDA